MKVSCQGGNPSSLKPPRTVLVPAAGQGLLSTPSGQRVGTLRYFWLASAPDKVPRLAHTAGGCVNILPQLPVLLVDASLYLIPYLAKYGCSSVGREARRDRTITL